MATITPRQMRNLDGFNSQVWSRYQQPEKERRWIVSKHCSIKFAWVASLLALFSFLSLLAEIIS